MYLALFIEYVYDFLHREGYLEGYYSGRRLKPRLRS